MSEDPQPLPSAFLVWEEKDTMDFHVFPTAEAVLAYFHATYSIKPDQDKMILDAIEEGYSKFTFEAAGAAKAVVLVHPATMHSASGRGGRRKRKTLRRRRL